MKPLKVITLLEFIRALKRYKYNQSDQLISTLIYFQLNLSSMYEPDYMNTYQEKRKNNRIANLMKTQYIHLPFCMQKL